MPMTFVTIGLIILSGNCVGGLTNKLNIVLSGLPACLHAKKKLLKVVVVYPSYNDIHDFFLSEISRQRSRHLGQIKSCRYQLALACGKFKRKEVQVTLITAASCKTNKQKTAYLDLAWW